MNAEPPSFSFFSLPSGFFLLPISLTGDAPCQPHLYVKVHRENDDDEEEEEGMHRRQTNNDGGRSSSSNNPHAVFVVGLPLLWRPLAPVLESLFGAYGDVEAVAVHPDQCSAIVSFSSPKALTTLTSAAAARSAATLHLPPLSSTATRNKRKKKEKEKKKKRKFDDDDDDDSEDDDFEKQQPVVSPPHGLKLWVEDHKRRICPGNVALSARLDRWVDDFEKEAELAATAAARAASGDGWTLVTRGEKSKKKSKSEGTTPIPAGSVAIASGGVAPAAAAAAAAAKAKRLAQDFYRFRSRDARRGELAELRSRFEEDRARVAALRAARRFRPE